MKKLLLVAMFFANSAWATYLPSSVSRIYSYGCTHNFIEGEGVSADGNRITCLSGQHLGIYSAEYKFYLFQTNYRNNFSSRGTREFFPSPICGLSVDRYSCSNAPQQIEFGLSEYSEGPFNIAVSLTASPREGSQVVGFAAPTFPDGTCPLGMVRIRPAMAYPPSMSYPLPSSFRNESGRLNAWLISVEGYANEPFKIYRTPGVLPCDSFGNCQWPTGQTYLANQSPYIESTPVVCAISPRNL